MRHSPIPRSDLSQALRCGAIALLAVILVACASRTRAPVDDRTALPAQPPAPAAMPAPASAAEADSRGPTYTVKRGDTLYQIALDHGLDYKELAAWNNLENPNKILAGQVLRVTAPGDATAAAAGVTTAPLKGEGDPAGGGCGGCSCSGVAGAHRPQRRQLQVLAEGIQGTLFRAGAARRRAGGAGPA
jgi:hypothetical protein